MAEKSSLDEVSIQVTHSVTVQNGVPSVPFHVMAERVESSAADSTMENSVLGEDDFVVWQSSPAVTATIHGLVYSPP